MLLGDAPPAGVRTETEGFLPRGDLPPLEEDTPWGHIGMPESDDAESEWVDDALGWLVSSGAASALDEGWVDWLTNIGGGALSGAAAGLAGGPIGALVGGLAGAGMGAIQTATQQAAAPKPPPPRPTAPAAPLHPAPPPPAMGRPSPAVSAVPKLPAPAASSPRPTPPAVGVDITTAVMTQLLALLPQVISALEHGAARGEASGGTPAVLPEDTDEDAIWVDRPEPETAFEVITVFPEQESFETTSRDVEADDDPSLWWPVPATPTLRSEQSA